MRLFSEPESWVGLRSERAVAGEFESSRDTPRMPQVPASGVMASSPLRWVGDVRRRLAIILRHTTPSL